MAAAVLGLGQGPQRTLGMAPLATYLCRFPAFGGPGRCRPALTMGLEDNGAPPSRLSRLAQHTWQGGGVLHAEQAMQSAPNPRNPSCTCKHATHAVVPCRRQARADEGARAGAQRVGRARHQRGGWLMWGWVWLRVVLRNHTVPHACAV